MENKKKQKTKKKDKTLLSTVSSVVAIVVFLGITLSTIYFKPMIEEKVPVSKTEVIKVMDVETQKYVETETTVTTIENNSYYNVVYWYYHIAPIIAFLFISFLGLLVQLGFLFIKDDEKAKALKETIPEGSKTIFDDVYKLLVTLISQGILFSVLFIYGWYFMLAFAIVNFSITMGLNYNIKRLNKKLYE